MTIDIYLNQNILMIQSLELLNLHQAELIWVPGHHVIEGNENDDEYEETNRLQTRPLLSFENIKDTLTSLVKSKLVMMS